MTVDMVFILVVGAVMIVNAICDTINNRKNK